MKATHYEPHLPYTPDNEKCSPWLHKRDPFGHEVKLLGDVPWVTL